MPLMKVLETERLVLRRLSSDDAEFILELLNQPSFLHTSGIRELEPPRTQFVTFKLARSRATNALALGCI